MSHAPRAAGPDPRKVALAAAVALALVAFFALGGPRYLSLEALRAHREALLAFTERNYAAALLAAGLVYAAATALSVPGALAMSLAVGFLFGRWTGTALVVVAATAGATAAFLGARYLFAEAARRRMGPRLRRMSDGFERDAFSYLLFLRLVPLFPFWLVNLAPAFTGVKARTFVAATALGIVPGTFVFVNLGESLGRIETLDDLLGPRMLLALSLLGVLSLVPVLVKRIRPPRSGESA